MKHYISYLTATHLLHVLVFLSSLYLLLFIYLCKLLYCQLLHPINYYRYYYYY